MKYKLLGAIALCSLCTNSFALDGQVHAHAYNTKSHESHNGQVNSLHIASFANNTDCIQTINMTYSLCSQFLGCVTKTYTVKVNPHDIWQDNLSLHKMVQYNRLGKYIIYADTVMEGSITRKEHSEAKIEVYD